MGNVFKNEPVLTSQIAGLVVSAAAIFGLNLTVDQAVLLVSAVQLVVSLIARAKVTPTT